MIRKLNINKIFKLASLRNYATSIPKKILSELDLDADLVSCLSKNLRISQTKIIGLFLKNPNMSKISKDHANELFSIFERYDLDKKGLLLKPLLLNLTPIGIERRAEILLECGFKKLEMADISKILTLLNKTISELKSLKYIPQDVNVQDRLTTYFSMWPCSPPMSANVDDSSTTLLELRLRVLQRYLELTLNLQSEDFQRAIKSYPRMRSRPFSHINLTLQHLRNLLKMPDKTIKKNLFVLNTYPNRICKLLTEVKTLSGVDIEDVINKKPSVLINKLEGLLEIESLLNDYKVPLDSQQRHLDIYTLGYSTVQKRFLDAFNTPEYKALLNNPRMLRLILYKNRADTRLKHLKSTNKMGFSLNILSSKNSDFKKYDENPHRIRCNDFIQNICYGLGNKHSFRDIYDKLKRHPFYNKTTTMAVKETQDNLSKRFSDEEIYLNCQILLYTWERIKVHLFPLLHLNNAANEEISLPVFSRIKGNLILHDKLTHCQILNLVLYYMEIEHNFSGYGIWQPGLNKIDENILSRFNS